jgi:hypothetical protein
MRIQAIAGIGCAMLAVLASAAPLAASSRASSPDPVRLVLPEEVLRAGQSVEVTVVNTEHALILRGLCLALAHRVGSRWVLVRRTHGVSVSCPPTASIPQNARSRESVTLPLYDDLFPGLYRVSLRYKRAARGPNLGRLAGPGVRTVQAQLTVLGFRPGLEPRLGERRILARALQAAKANGDPHPSLVQHAEGTRFEAVLVSSGDLVFEWNWSILIVIRGHFSATNVPVPPGARPRAGTVLTLVIDARTGQGTDFGLGHRYPKLAGLGSVTTDLRSAP